jgi:hypothetical protein
MISPFRDIFLTLCVLSSLLDGSMGQGCFDDTKDINDAENMVSDYSQVRAYTICPRTNLEIGTLDQNFEVVGSVSSPPLTIRPNMHLRCGDTASRDNFCWFSGGDLHLDATNFLMNGEATVDNVLIQGFVFIDSHRYSLWATKSGSITFRDCEWRVSFLCVTIICIPLWANRGRGELNGWLILCSSLFFHRTTFIPLLQSCWISLTRQTLASNSR